MRAIRLTAGAAAVLTFGLIVLGALVRSTNSGLSCPDWPTCYGYWVPLPGHAELYAAAGYTYTQVMLEWVHRAIAGLLLGPLVLALVALTFRARRMAPALFPTALVLIGLLVVQKLLGGITVLDANSPWSVALHLGNALLVLAVILLIFERSGGAAPEARHRGLGRLGAAVGATAWLAMISAAMTAKSGASLACATWPSCNGALVPDLGDPLVAIHFTHRLLAAATGLLILALFVQARRRPDLPAGLHGLPSLALGLVLVQVTLGALVILWQVPVSLAVLHQAVGVLTFMTIVVVMWRTLPVAAGHGVERSGGADGLALRGA
jgi:cytochrome c oxidase assembly protein subunit 15